MRACHRVLLLLALSVLWLGVSGGRAGAQPAADHQYTSADIEAGSRLYANQCSLCHGPNGDGVNGVDLRRGVFRRSVSDEDLARVITSGIAAAGMPGFKFQPAELNAVLAFIRAGFDPSGTAVKVGQSGARPDAVCRQGELRQLSPRRTAIGPRTAPDLSDIGAVRTPAALQRSLLDPTSAHAADQPARCAPSRRTARRFADAG